MSLSTVPTVERVYRGDTLEAYQRGVERAIQVMQARLGEPLTVDDLADAAFMSRHHFTRVFAKITGVSPGRFLAAVRMQEAKRLLLKTDRSVTDISFDVGYNSLGTFNRTFAEFVGFPPVRYQQLSLALLDLTIDDVEKVIPPHVLSATSQAFTGRIVSSPSMGLLIVAVFRTAIPRSRPVECHCLVNSRSFSFNHRLVEGAYLFAIALERGATMLDALLPGGRSIRVGASGQLRGWNTDLRIELHEPAPSAPPVVVAFPLLILEKRKWTR